MVDYVELGFWLLAAFAVILFFQTILTWRKYKLLRTQYEKMSLEYEAERKELREIEEEIHAKFSQHAAPPEKLSELQNRLENLEATASIEHAKLEQALADLSEANATPNVGEKIFLGKQAEKEGKRLTALEKKLKKTSDKQIILSKKITAVRSVKSQLEKGRRKLSQLSQEHSKLKRQFQEHELIPVHATGVGEEVVQEEIERVNKSIRNIDGQLKTLGRTLADAEQKLSLHEKSLEVVKEKVL